MPQINDIRACMLQVISDRSPKRPGEGNLQSGSTLGDVKDRLGIGRDHVAEEAVLTVFHDLFRTGFLAWGFNLGNPNPPYFHVTDQGRKSLANLSRDPSNPDGYFGNLAKNANLSPIASSYLREAVACFVQDLPKACAVMVGASAESMVLELRDAIVTRLQTLSQPLPKGIDDWKIKTVLDVIFKFIDENSAKIAKRELKDAFKAYWPAYVQQIRAVRNEAGHPSSVDPITYDTVHASLLIFPELAKLAGQLIDWVSNEYK